MRALAITPGDGRALGPWIEALGEAGLPALLLREPRMDPHTLASLVDHAQAHIPQVILHARTPGAWDLDLPVHLPRDQPPPADRVFGQSCHDAASLDAAFAAGARWALLSPVHRPRSKPDDPRPPLGPARFLQLAAGRPVLALGGMDLERGRALLEAGAYGIAAISLFFEGSPAQVARRCAALLQPSPTMKKRSS